MHETASYSRRAWPEWQYSGRLFIQGAHEFDRTPAVAGATHVERFGPSQHLTMEETAVAKAYWVVMYHSIDNPEAFAAYAKIAPPAVQAAGGRFLVRGMPAKVYEEGLNQRLVVIEFDSLAQALAAHETPAYAEALRVLGDGARRDMRIVEGLA
jgi:uncharacterized protein (DUF1330 family)